MEKIRLIVFSVICIFFFTFYNNSFSQSGWIEKKSGVITDLYSIKFINSNTGLAVGNNGKILRSTNGGNNWSQLDTSYRNDLYSLSFPAQDISYIAGDSGLVLKSTDSGISWFRLQSINSHYSYSSVFFLNELEGYIGGSSYIYPSFNKIFKTLNGGITWDSLLTGPDQNSFINTIFFINQNTGWIIKIIENLGTENLYKTTDGGISWLYQFNIPNINTVFFYDSLYGWLSGYGSGPYVYSSTNGGSNWSGCWFCGIIENYSLYFLDREKGWGASYGVINYTTNGGANWLIQNTNHPQRRYKSIYFIDSLTGWVAGDSGVILKTTTGGVLTGFTNTSTEIPDRYYLSQNYPNPFNPSTKISYELRVSSYATLKVFDVLGNEVAALVNENKPAGSYEVEFSAESIGRDLASGVYFYSLSVDGVLVDTKRMALIR